MNDSIFPWVYGFAVLVLLWQAYRLVRIGLRTTSSSSYEEGVRMAPDGDRTGRLTIHPELLDGEGRITEEELLTVRFSGDADPPQSAETSAE